MPPAPILLVYDAHPPLPALIQEQLADWRVVTTGDLGQGREAQAVLLAGSGDHIALAQDLRESGMIGPIFSLGGTASAPLIPLSHPLRLASLTSRLQTQDGGDVDGAMIGNWRIDLAQRALIEGERIERLTDKEFALLELLLRARGETIDAKKLQSDIWRYHEDADSHTVETHIWRLRQKLEIDPADPQILLTGSDGYFIKPR